MIVKDWGLVRGQQTHALPPWPSPSLVLQPSTKQAGMCQGQWWESGTALTFQGTTADPRPGQEGSPGGQARVRSRNGNQHHPYSHGKSCKSACGPRPWSGLVRHSAKHRHACRVADAAGWAGTGGESRSLGSAAALGEDGQAPCFWLFISRRPAALPLSWPSAQEAKPSVLGDFQGPVSAVGY